MNPVKLKRFLIAPRRLTPGQKAELLAASNEGGHGEEVRLLLESRLTDARACPHCHGVRGVCNGGAGGLQRYKLRTFCCTFNALSSTPLARLPIKAKWLRQQAVLLQGLSVNKAAAELDVAATTAFR